MERRRSSIEPAKAADRSAAGRRARAGDGDGPVRVRSQGSPQIAGLPPAVREALRSSGSGEPLPAGIRERLSASLGADLDAVRIHRGEAAARAARAVGARAFTVGTDVYLGRGEQPTDLGLLAHEVAHVVQQRGEPAVQLLAEGAGADPLEREAERVSRAVQQGQPATVHGRSTGAVVQRSIWGSIGSAVAGAVSAVAEVGAGARDAFLGRIGAWARLLPGYALLTFALGRDPIEDRPVERTASALIGAIVGLVPGGSALWANLERSGAIQRAGEFFSGEIEKLGLTWAAIRALLREAWDALGVGDLLNPAGGWEKVRRVFGPPLARLRDFAVRSVTKIAEFVFEGALALAGGAGERVLAIFRRIGATFSLIVADPVRFLGNLVAAVTGGFSRFSANILAHLKTGIVGWLTGAMQGAIVLPSRFDFRGILSIVLQVLGLTYRRIRDALVRRVGEPAVRFLEGAFELLRLLVSEGPVAAWKKIMEYASDLTDAVLAGIRDWVARSVIVAAVTKLATMFNPAGAVIQAVIATYNTVMFFIERAKQIAALLEAVVDSISNIAQGAIGAAVAFVEQAMVRGLTVAIGFLARLIGLGDVAGHVRRIIGRIQAVVDRALDRVIGFIVERGGALLRGKGQQAPPAAAAAGAADAPAADTLHERKEGGHTIRVRRDLSVVQLSTPTSVSGDRAQQARQKALEALVPRKPVRYPMDGDRAAGPIGHVEDVKSGEARAPMSFRGPGYQPGDHRGHLVGDRFWGPPEGRNLVPMHRELNLSTFKRFENEAAKKFLALKRAGQAVLLWMRAIPNYPAAKADDPARYRPTSVSASARISGLKAGSSPVEEETIDPGPLQNPPP